MLFCDIRGFSRITERLGPQKTIAWTGNVLGDLSECVLREQGVLVDYVGDELMAMWGAPDHQPDHARRACRAALDMLAQLPALNDQWAPVVGETVFSASASTPGRRASATSARTASSSTGRSATPSTSPAACRGPTNTGRRRSWPRPKRTPSSGTAFATRRLGQIRVVNIQRAGDPLRAVASRSARSCRSCCVGYENALTLFEKKEFRQTTRILGKLLPEFPADGPSLVLMTRAVQCLVESPEAFDPVWNLPGK